MKKYMFLNLNTITIDQDKIFLFPIGICESQSRNSLPLMNTKFYKSQPLNPILSQINPVHILTSYCFKIYFNIILSSNPNFIWK
jgi:hypothetical protein